MPYESRGALGSHGPRAERFTRQTWTARDICDRRPWPYADDQFDFAICSSTLEGVRDPIWVCQELSRVAKAGYVEVPTIEAELVFNAEGDGPWLGREDHRWLCDVDDGALRFTHKPHSIHHDWTLRVSERWHARMQVEDHLLGLFWEERLPAFERPLIGEDDYQRLLEELRGRVRHRFEPSDAELRIKTARDLARHGAAVAVQRPRKFAEALIDRLR